MIGDAGVFFADYFDEFKTRLQAKIADATILFGRKNKPAFTKKRTVIVAPISSALEEPMHAGNWPLQIFYDRLTFEVTVRSDSFADMMRVRQIVLSVLVQAREGNETDPETPDANPFANCSIKPTGTTYQEQGETDAYETCVLSVEFASPVYNNEDELPELGEATTVLVTSVSVT